jgi:hypothetical protein
MKKLDNTMIEVDGKFYMYDYDHDCYFRVSEPRTETLRERIINISVALGLLIAIVAVTKYFS